MGRAFRSPAEGESARGGAHGRGDGVKGKGPGSGPFPSEKSLGSRDEWFRFENTAQPESGPNGTSVSLARGRYAGHRQKLPKESFFDGGALFKHTCNLFLIACWIVSVF